MDHSQGSIVAPKSVALSLVVRPFCFWKLALSCALRISDTAQKLTKFAAAFDKPAIIAFGADRKRRAAATSELFWIGGVLRWQVLAAHAARVQLLSAKASVLTAIEGASLFGGFCQHTSAALTATMLSYSRCAELDDSVRRVFDPFADERRWLFSVSKDRDAMACTGECNVEQSSFFSVLKFFRFG